MDSPSLNHYEEQLYSVFKTFDVHNEEALNKASVLALCDALQLEERGATLVDALFERRPARVTFAQFRSGLLSVLGGDAPSPQRPRAEVPHSDDDSSGREVAPKFVFGSKKYGRRSRPQRTTSVPEDISKLTSPESDSAEAPDRARRRYRSARSVSATAAGHSSTDRSSTADLLSENVDHDTRIDCKQALELCRQLHMDNIDRHLIEQIFKNDELKETTVGEFFDRLNESLTSSIAVSSNDITNETLNNTISDIDNCDLHNDIIPKELVIETWERAGIQEPQRLLSELGFTGIPLVINDLEQALEGELCTLSEPSDARSILLTAALSLSRLCVQRAQSAVATAIAERNRLRADVAECNKRARILAQEVDENHARLEKDLTANLKRAESRHAEAVRALEDELARERERAAADRAASERDLARRADNEARLREQLHSIREKALELESRANAAETRCEHVESERAQLAAQLRELELKRERDSEQLASTEGELAARLEQLRRDNTRLRDRCDELSAQLEARHTTIPLDQRAGSGASWRDEAGGGATQPQHDNSEELDSSLASVEWPAAVETKQEHAGVQTEHVGAQTEHVGAQTEHSGAQTEHSGAQTEHAGAQTEHAGAQTEPEEREAERLRQERDTMEQLVRELECNLEEMRMEYERCEEYWSGKLAGERQQQAEEQAAADRRLAQLAARIQEYEAQFAPQGLPTIDERPSFELQVTALEEELQRARDERERDARAHREREAALQGQLERLRGRQGAAGGEGAAQGAQCGGCARWAAAWRAEVAGAQALRARCGRAEAAVSQLGARLSARLAAADLLVKDLYVESCRAPLPPRRL